MPDLSAQAKRWQQVESLFRGAVELPAAEREDYLEAACQGDQGLRLEVEGLLESDAEVAQGDFIAAAVQAGEELLSLGDHEVLPPRFGKYEVESRLGEGGFGVVYKGHDPRLARSVAIKACASIDKGLRKRFYREARIAAGLRHPNITTVHELGVEDGVPFLVQELLDGEDLRQIIADRRSLPLVTLVDYLVQIARGLDHAHQSGVLHRDVKPANVRILPDGSVKLMDFGIAKLLGADTGLTGTGTTLGTVGYLAPEQLRSEDVDERVDVFAFGVVAYELLGGRRPFRGDDFSQVSYQLLYEEPILLSEAWPECPTDLVDLVHRCLEKERSARPGSFSSLAAELEMMLNRLRSSSLRSAVRPGVFGGGQVPSRTERLVSSELVGPIEGRQSLGKWVAIVGLVGLVSGGWWWQLQKGDTGLEEVSRRPGDGAAVPDLVDSLVETAGREGGELLQPPREAENESLGQADFHPQDSLGVSPALQSPAEHEQTDREEPIVEPEPVLLPSAEAPGFDFQPGFGGQPESTTLADSDVSAAGLYKSEVDPEELGARSVDWSANRVPDQASVEREKVVDEVPQALPDGEVSRQEESEIEASETVGAESVLPSSDLDHRPTIVSSQLPDMTPGGLITGEGSGVIPPKLLDRPQPEYPSRARRRRIEGRAVVKVLVDETGQVVQAIAPGKDQHGFLAAARQAALGARFEPPSRDGIRGRMWINVPFDFSLE